MFNILCQLVWLAYRLDDEEINNRINWYQPPQNTELRLLNWTPRCLSLSGLGDCQPGSIK